MFKKGLNLRNVAMFACLAVSVSFVGCEKSENKGKDVYIAGTGIKKEQGSSFSAAKLWKNGKDQYLTTDYNGGTAWSVYVSGKDIYVAGHEFKGRFGLSGVPNGVAVLWKNGVRQDLTDGTYSASAFSVYVSDNNVYVAGFECVKSGEYEQRVAKLWKNGVEQNLADAYGATATSVFVSNNDVYVAGNGLDGAKLWKNGEMQYLTDATFDTYASSVFVFGNDVYVTGSKTWKNGDVLYSNGGSSIFVSDNDVYVAGNGKFWKNGVAQELTGSTSLTFPTSVYVSHNNVFVVGYDGTDGRIKLWKNGKKQKVPDTFAEAYCVFVK